MQKPARSKGIFCESPRVSKGESLDVHISPSLTVRLSQNAEIYS